MMRFKSSFAIVGPAAALLTAIVVAPAYAAPAEAEAPKADVTKSTAPLAEEDTGTAKKADRDAQPKAPACSQADIKNPGFGCDKSR